MAVLNVDYTVTKQSDGVTDATKVPLQLPVPGAAANAWGAMMNDNFKSISTAFEYIGLQDLNITDGSSGDVLVTDGSGNFSFATLNLGASNIEDLNNVATGSLSDQDFITYDNANSQWVNTTVADVKTRLNLHTVATSGDYNDLGNLPDLSLKADLVSGKIPASQIPAIAVTEYMGVVADQTAMLALAGEKGDWCNRTDTGTMWIRTGTGNTIADWVEINYPADAVSSVNGQNGVVVLSAADVGALPSSTYIPQAGVDFDAPGTDNSTATSLDTTNHDYLSVSGTTITLGPIDLTADVTNQLPASGVSGLATVATSNDYNDLTNLPTLTVVAQGDVTVPTATLAAGQFLAWDATNAVWTNASIGYGGQIVLHGTGAGAVSFTYTMDSLTDVTIDTNTLTNGQTLVYNGSTQQWENSNPVATGITRTVDTNNNAIIFSFA